MLRFYRFGFLEKHPYLKISYVLIDNLKFEIKKKTKKKTSFIQLTDKHIFHHQELATSFR